MKIEAEVEGRILALSIRAQEAAYTVELEGRTLRVEARFDLPFLSLSIDGRRHELGVVPRGRNVAVTSPTGVVEVELRDAARFSDPGAPHGPSGPARVTAPMPGKIVRVLVSAGQAVEAGDSLLVVEAMKMENELRAPRGGVVLDLPAREGQAVESGALLAIVG